MPSRRDVCRVPRHRRLEHEGTKKNGRPETVIVVWPTRDAGRDTPRGIAARAGDPQILAVECRLWRKGGRVVVRLQGCGLEWTNLQRFHPRSLLRQRPQLRIQHSDT